MSAPASWKFRVVQIQDNRQVRRLTDAKADKLGGRYDAR